MLEVNIIWGRLHASQLFGPNILNLQWFSEVSPLKIHAYYWPFTNQNPDKVLKFCIDQNQKHYQWSVSTSSWVWHSWLYHYIINAIPTQPPSTPSESQLLWITWHICVIRKLSNTLAGHWYVLFKVLGFIDGYMSCWDLACWTTDHYHPCSNPYVGHIWRLFHPWLCFITYHVH